MITGTKEDTSKEIIENLCTCKSENMCMHDSISMHNQAIISIINHHIVNTQLVASYLGSINKELLSCLVDLGH